MGGVVQAPGVWVGPQPVMTSLIGRDDDLAEVHELVATRGHLVTICGPAGAGKTALAMRIAADLVERSRAVATVFLAEARDADDVLPSISRQLSLREPPLDDLRPASTWLASALPSDLSLLILDNLEHLLGARSAISELLTHRPDLTVLVTSRIALRLPGEVVYALGSLATPPNDGQMNAQTALQSPAVVLFADRAAEARAGFVVTDAMSEPIVRLCQRLDGLPLAIELAAARVRIFGPRDLLARLESGHLSLGERASTTAPHQRTLEQALAWSHDLLTDGQRALFRRLSVFAGGWTLAMAEAIGSAPTPMGTATMTDQPGTPDDIGDALTALVDANLVRQTITPEGGTRFGFLQTIHAFAHGQLALAGETESTMRQMALWARAYVTQAERDLARDTDATLPVLEREEANLRTCVHWALGQQDAELAISLMSGALWLLWGTKGRLKDEGQAMERALAIAQHDLGHMPDLVLARGWNAAGSRWVALGSHEQARSALDQALGYWRVVEPEALRQRGLANATMNLSVLALEQGDYDIARTLLQESLAVRRAIGVGPGTVLALNNLGDLEIRAGNPEHARTWLDQGLALAEDIGSFHMVAGILITISDADRLMGDLAGARAHGEQGVALLKHIGDQRMLRQGLITVARASVVLGDLRAALDQLVEAFQAATVVGEPSGVADALDILIEIMVPPGGEIDAPRAETVSRMLGAAQSLRGEKAAIPQDLREARKRATEGVRAALPGSIFRTAWGAGSHLDLMQAAALGTTHAQMMRETLASEPRERARTEQVRADRTFRPARTDRHTDHVDHLTPREREVLRLLVDGKTDQEIADDLFISRRTANNHVARILDKLAVSSRSAAVSRALRHGLVGSR